MLWNYLALRSSKMRNSFVVELIVSYKDYFVRLINDIGYNVANAGISKKNKKFVITRGLDVVKRPLRQETLIVVDEYSIRQRVSLFPHGILAS